MTTTRYCAAALLAALVLTRPASAGDTAFPRAEWQEADPASQGVDRAKLEAAVEYLKAHAGRDGVGELVIVRNGYVIWQGDRRDKVHGIWSCTKSFTSTCLGLLIDDGKCTLDTLAKDFLPAMAKAYPAVTLRHFTTMTSGYRAIGDEPRGRYLHGPSQTPLAPNPEPLFAPGSHYAYWDSAMNQFAHVLTRIAGEPLDELFRRRIADPIGMDPNEWRWGDFGDVDGFRVNGGSGNNNNHVFISARQMARLGRLFLHRGNWSGRQLISAAWVDQATSVQVPPATPLGHPESGIDGPGVYGFNWWSNGRHPDGRPKWPGAPAGTFAASGHNNNDMFVIPDWNMVITRLGLDQADHAITDKEYGLFLRKVGQAITDATVEGPRRVWHPLTVTFRGPEARQTDDRPNPFLDFRLQVTFSGPSGQSFGVPGYFDGDGHGGSGGNLWRVRFTPDEAGRWQYKASFRQDPELAVSLGAGDGKPLAFDGATGFFNVQQRDPQAPGFLQWGRLRYVGKHYPKFADGPYWIRGGTDSPENFLAYDGFDNTPPSHRFAAHADDWRPGDPDWGDGRGKPIIGALNYLASRNVNSLYCLTMNVGGDGKDVWPWAGSPDPQGNPANDNLHVDLGKLHQWETVLAHAQRCGIFLHFVLNEAEKANKLELDDGELGTERKLYYRDLVARFGHHLALEWNLSEEYNLGWDFGPDRVRRFADYLCALDPYGHPIAVHPQGDPFEALKFTFGDQRFSMTSIQLNQRPIDELVERFRRATAESGRPLPISMDEFTVDVGTNKSHIPVDVPDLHRKQKLWPTYLSGGMIEFILEGLLDMDSFKTPQRDALWRYTWYARKFMEENLPFWEMEPDDDLVTGETTIAVGMGRGQTYQLGAQVFAKPGDVYAVYLPAATQTGRIDLAGAAGAFQLRWYNPRQGRFEGEVRTVPGGTSVPLGTPPAEPEEDWAVLLRR